MKRRRSKPKLQNPDQTPTTPNSYSFSLTKIAVSQICTTIGYKSTDSSTSLNTLTLITTKYLQSLAELASSFANTANRTEVNVFDIVNALQNITLATSDYFPGGAYNNNSLIKSGVLRNLLDFVNNSPEIPFARALPKREIVVVDRTSSSNRSPMVNNYVPAWLPDFPEVSQCNENCVKKRSDLLWGDDLLESSRSDLESCGNRGRSGGVLPVRRAVVRFKLSNGGVGNRLERWRGTDDGDDGREFVVKKKICEGLVNSPGIFAGLVLYGEDGIRTRDV